MYVCGCVSLFTVFYTYHETLDIFITSIYKLLTKKQQKNSTFYTVRPVILIFLLLTIPEGKFLKSQVTLLIVKETLY